jgi:hypothetical protein
VHGRQDSIRLGLCRRLGALGARVTAYAELFRESCADYVCAALLGLDTQFNQSTAMEGFAAFEFDAGAADAAHG